MIVGAGAQGAPCAAVLAYQPGVARVLLGTRELADAASVRDRLGSPKVAAAEFDARQPDQIVRGVRESLGTVDVVIDLTPSFISRHIMEAALALGAHYVNTAASPEHLAQLIQGQPLDPGRPVRFCRTHGVTRLRSKSRRGEYHLPPLLR